MLPETPTYKKLTQLFNRRGYHFKSHVLAHFDGLEGVVIITGPKDAICRQSFRFPHRTPNHRLVTIVETACRNLLADYKHFYDPKIDSYYDIKNLLREYYKTEV